MVSLWLHQVDDCVLLTKLGNKLIHAQLHALCYLDKVFIDCIIIRIHLGWCISFEGP